MSGAASGPRIGWITTDLVALDDPDRDLGPVGACLAAAGVEVVPLHWRDGGVLAQGHLDAAVIRSPWDYPDHLDAFVVWLTRAADEVPIFNDPATITWNLDKAYLLELAAAGLPVVSSDLADSVAEVRGICARLADEGHARVVVKPNVSAGSRDTGLFSVDDPGGCALAERIVASGRRVLVQPEVPGVATEGERGVVLFDGVVSHAIRKGPILEVGGGLRGGHYTEEVTLVEVTDAEVALAQAVVAACPGPVPLYARVDLVATGQGPCLLEAELFEPSLFCDLTPAGARCFADAIRHRLNPSIEP